MPRKLLSALLPAQIRRILKQKFMYMPVTRPYDIRVGAKRLTGQVAVVTGGSGTIGRAICAFLAAEGAKVYVGGTRPDRITAVVDEIRELGGAAEAAAFDLTAEDRIIGEAQRIFEQEGRIDIWVNSAGGSARAQHAALTDLPTAVLRKTLEINLTGTILCCREAVRYMTRGGHGRIICIGSVIGERGKACYSEYAAAKAGIAGFCRSLAQEVGSSGITVNCVSPGIVVREPVNGDTIENLKKTNHMDDYGKAEDVAAAVLYFAAPEAAFVTGQNLVVDGGRTLSLRGG